jgi:hypothetical protein
MTIESVVMSSRAESRKRARVIFGRCEIRLHGRARWRYWKWPKAFDSISKSLGYRRFAWFAFGPVDVRWFYRKVVK